MNIEYIIFGIVDNAIMLLGAFTGLEVEKFLPKSFQKGIGVTIGAGLGNATSDWFGGASTLNFELANGTALGCIIGLLLIPVFIYVGKLRKGVK